MANDPQFTSVINVGSCLVPATNDSSLTAPTHISTLFTPGANGSRVEEIRIYGVGTTVAGRVNLFRYDGSSYWLIDQYMIIAVTPGAGTMVFFQNQPYTNLELKSTDTLAVSVMEASNESLVALTAFGGNF